MAVHERSPTATIARGLALPSRVSPGLALAAVMLAGLGLRLWGVDYGLPYVYHPDEPFMIGVAWTMYRSGDLNPHFWDYPTMQLYALLALLTVREGFRDWLPFLAAPGMEYLLGRLLNVAYALGTIALVYRTGRRLLGPWEGVVAAALLATAEQHNLMSHFLKVDVPTTFWVTAALAASARLLVRPGVGAYVLAGALVGLAAAGKYPAATVGIVVAVAHCLAWRRADVLRQGWRLLLAGVCAPLAFAIACPYTVLDAGGFLAAFRGDIVDWAATGHDGWDGDVLSTYLRWLFLSPDAPMTWLALLGAGLGVAGRRFGLVALIGAFPLLYLAELSGLWVVRFPWYVLPMEPFLALLGGWGALEAARRLSGLRRPLAGAWLLLVALGIGAQLLASADESSLLAAEDVRTTALHWVEATLPPGSRIAREGYTPEINGQRFQVAVLWRAIDREPEWYRDERIEYLVLGNLMYGRYFKDPEKYALQVGQYRALTAGATLVGSFEGPALGGRGAVVDVWRLAPRAAAGR